MAFLRVAAFSRDLASLICNKQHAGLKDEVV